MRSDSENNWLRLEQLDRRLGSWRKTCLDAPPPRKGWVRAIRTTLGMSQEQLARRMGVHTSRIGQIERGEVEGTVTLATLRQVADALGARLVTGLVPETSLQQMVEKQAEEVAADMMETVGQTMKLEEQATGDASRSREKARLKDSLLRDSWKKLWS